MWICNREPLITVYFNAIHLEPDFNAVSAITPEPSMNNQWTAECRPTPASPVRGQYWPSKVDSKTKICLDFIRQCKMLTMQWGTGVKTNAKGGVDLQPGEKQWMWRHSRRAVPRCRSKCVIHKAWRCHCSVVEVNIVMFINQIEYVSVGILISKSPNCVHSLLLCIFKVKTLTYNEKVQIFPP
jgi:hypothetical protein